jgi:hypothetical protein
MESKKTNSIQDPWIRYFHLYGREKTYSFTQSICDVYINSGGFTAALTFIVINTTITLPNDDLGSFNKHDIVGLSLGLSFIFNILCFITGISTKSVIMMTGNKLIGLFLQKFGMIFFENFLLIFGHLLLLFSGLLSISGRLNIGVWISLIIISIMVMLILLIIQLYTWKWAYMQLDKIILTETSYKDMYDVDLN